VIEDEWAAEELEAKTVSEAIDAYNLHLKEKGTGDISRLETLRRLRIFFEPVRDVQVGRLTPAHAEKLYLARDASGAISGGFVIGRSVDYHRNTLGEAKTFARFCVDRGWAKVSPVEQVQGIGKRKAGKPQLTGDEAHRFLFAGLWMAEAGDLGALGCLMLLTMALRQKDVCVRVVRDLDLGATQLRIERGKTAKSNRPRKVPAILQGLLANLAANRSPLEPLFGAAGGGHHTKSWLRKAAKRVCAAAGVPYVPPHGLKGTSGNMLAEDGAEADRIVLHLSHEERGTTMRHYVDQGTVDAVQAERALVLIQGGRK
jgi:integrase